MKPYILLISLVLSMVFVSSLGVDIPKPSATTSTNFYNVTYNTWAYNQTASKWFYNMSDGGMDYTNVAMLNETNDFQKNISTNGSVHVYGTSANQYVTIDTGIDLNFVGKPADPSVALIATDVGNVDAGVHYYSVTYYTALGETSASTYNAATVTTDATHKQVTVTIPVSTDYRVIGRKIYRTKVGGSSYHVYALDEVDNNVDTEYIDNIADADLTGTISAGYWRADTTNAVFMVNGVSAAILSDRATVFGVGAKGGGGGVVIGQNAGSALTIGDQNTIVGDKAGQSIQTGVSNTLIGYAAGAYTGGTAGYNTGVGRDSLSKTTYHNTGIGYGSGQYITGYYNTLLGQGAGRGIPSGSSVEKSVLIGYHTAYVINTGDNNIGIGYQVMDTLTTGSNNIVIGYDIDTPATDTSNYLNIGNTITGDLSTKFLNFTGSANVVGNFTGNQIYGSIFYHNHTATLLNFAIDGVYYYMGMKNATYLNGFKSNNLGASLNSSMTALVSGLYKADYMAVGSGQNNHKYATTIFINEVMQDNCESHHKMSAGGDEITQSGSCFIRLTLNNNVSLRTADDGGTGTGNYYGANLNLVRIGN